jgi:hypothetical protein
MHSLKSFYHATRLVFLMVLLLNIRGIAYTQTSGDIIAELGFSPAVDGFSFENYDKGYTNLTEVEMERLFGSVVCQNTSDTGCKLTPTAKMWMESINQDMSNGHCEGLATLSLLFYTGVENVDEFGEGDTFSLELEGNDLLQREIAFWWATQMTNPTDDNVIYGSPSEIVSQLVDSMNSDGEIFTLGIYMRDGSGGHTVTPYAVTDQGNGINWILVYDSNWPDEELYIEVNTTSETWRYEVDSNDPATLYEGDAETQTLSLTPTSPRLETQDCPFCGDVDYESDEGYTSVSLNANGARLTVTDDAGNMTGYVDGKWVNNIPGARIIMPKNIFLGGSLPPQIQFPNGSPYKITATEGPDTPPFPGATFTVVRSGSVTKVGGIELGSEEETLNVDGSSIQYQSGNSDETPVIEQGVTSEGNDYHFVVEPQSPMGDNETLDVSFDSQNGEIQVGGSDDNAYSVDVDRIDEEGNESNFSIDNLNLPAGADANLNAGEWQEGEQITGEIIGEDGTTTSELNSNGESSEPDNNTGSEGQDTDTGSNSESGDE